MAASKNDVILYSRPPKGQLILKANFEVSSEPKTVRNFFVFLPQPEKRVKSKR